MNKIHTPEPGSFTIGTPLEDWETHFRKSLDYHSDYEPRPQTLTGGGSPFTLQVGIGYNKDTEMYLVGALLGRKISLQKCSKEIWFKYGPRMDEIMFEDLLDGLINEYQKLGEMFPFYFVWLRHRVAQGEQTFLIPAADAWSDQEDGKVNHQAQLIKEYLKSLGLDSKVVLDDNSEPILIGVER